MESSKDSDPVSSKHQLKHLEEFDNDLSNKWRGFVNVANLHERPSLLVTAYIAT
jgi:hypothetical protein